MKFPENFIWGASTSSYQIEGTSFQDGGGKSVWDAMCSRPGKILNGDTGEIACDHYHHYGQDVGLMSEVGIQAYRFSISWPRVLPDGSGEANQKGLDYYSHLVDALLEKNIEPWVTLFHWDYPEALYRRGGWLNRDSSDWFAEYAAVIVDRLSDRVSHWMTLNEPQCFIGLGHMQGNHAPGEQLELADVLQAGHNALLAHGKAVQVIRDLSAMEPVVGTALVGMPSMPASNSLQDIEAARNSMFSIREKNVFNNTWFADPMILGEYPRDGVELFGSAMPGIHDGDMKIIRQALDFFGTNIYWGQYYRTSGEDGFTEVMKQDLAYTAMNWPVTPEALYWGPKFFHDRYRLPIVVTENGMAHHDVVVNCHVRDFQRIEFLSRYLSEYGRAIADGVPALGYFLWSLMDNFEWAEGYSKRFGIIHIDYVTQQRTLKDSANWYKTVIEANGLTENPVISASPFKLQAS